MRILVVSSYLPYPLFSGGSIRLYSLLRLLAKNHKITLVCERRQFQTEDDIKEMRKICEKVITVKRRKQWSIKNILKTGFSFNPFLITGHQSREMTEKIKEELMRERYDLIHVETFYVMQNLPVISIPIVLVEHNIEYLVYKRFADKAPFFVKPLLLADVLKLKRKEEFFWQRATKLVAVSNIEKSIMRREDVAVVPNGVDIARFAFRETGNKFHTQEKRVLFIGDFKWMQNRDGASFLIKEVWPKISLKLKTENLKLWIVGKNIPEGIKELGANDKSILFDSNNKDETPVIFDKSFLLLAPIRIGGGTSYKILEAMASGTAVVTTNLGIEGLEAKDGIHVLTADDAHGFAAAAIKLLEDKNLYKTLAKNARKLVEENYDWNTIAEKLEKVYKSSLS